MSAIITVNQVNEYIPNSLPSTVISSFIAVASKADSCLDGSGVSDEIQEAIKLAAIAHMVSLSGGNSGEITSERSRTGAAITYKQSEGGTGLSSTSYGRLLQQLDTTGCLVSLFKQSRFIQSVGRG